MARDKSLSILLVVLFGISGVAILVLTWLQPMPGMERVLSTLIGATGLLVATGRGMLLRSAKAGANAESVPVKVEVKENA